MDLLIESENQGAPTPVIQGAQEENQGANESSTDDKEDESDSSNDEEPGSRSEERARRLAHFETNQEGYGRGKWDR